MDVDRIRRVLLKKEKKRDYLLRHWENKSVLIKQLSIDMKKAK